MARRSKRGSINKRAVLERLKEGRRGAIQVRTEAVINGPEYRAAGVALDSIDALAEELTGDRKVFNEMGTQSVPKGKTYLLGFWLE